MIYGKQAVGIIEKAIPGASAQYGYHGCNRASIQVFHDGYNGETGHAPRGSHLLIDWSCPCEGWGGGRLDVKPSEIVTLAKDRLALAAELRAA